MPSHTDLLHDLLQFIEDEQAAANERLRDIWQRPLSQKLEQGWSQKFSAIQRGPEAQTLLAFPDEGESRFREGDLLFLHSGDPFADFTGRGFILESEEEDYWLLRGDRALTFLDQHKGGVCYADPDAMDLTALYKNSLDDIAASQTGREILLPLLSGELPITFDERDYDEALQRTNHWGCNSKQAHAIALAYAAEQVACIQGPPGTGKTWVLALIVRLMVKRGERVLVTSHTHMAINNALNKIHSQNVPAVKIGPLTQRKGLDESIPYFASLDLWRERPTQGNSGYVVGATPFATCSYRLENYAFDTIVFDEASQITVPLALMAMRKGKRFIFIGDQKQLPPISQSRSVLAKETLSVFAHLTALQADHSVMLEETYRMNRWLCAWPSQTFYTGKLRSVGANQERKLELSEEVSALWNPNYSVVFIPSSDNAARTRNYRDAEKVVALCEQAHSGGLKLEQIGIVSPYRSQGRLIRNLLAQRFGHANAKKIVADTVERMQGQERELIILSLATSDSSFLTAVAEFFFQPERLNVSITRAMTKLIIIGPKIEQLPHLENPILQQWVKWYKELIEQCHVPED